MSIAGFDSARFFSTYESNLVGPLTLVSDGERLAQCRFATEKHPYDISGLERKDTLAVFRETRNWLDRYFSGERPTPSELDIAPQGTSFQMRVWNEIAKIPYGETTTYGDIAKELTRQGYPTSARAVGNATGRNSMVVIIPCHRVMGTGNKLTGFGGGSPLKKKLLELEGVDTSAMREPGK